MRKQAKEGSGTTVLFTMATLRALKDKGFRYVQVKGFTSDKRIDYMDPQHLVLIPITSLPAEAGEMEIYEPIESPLLREWAGNSHDGIAVLIASKI